MGSWARVAGWGEEKKLRSVEKCPRRASGGARSRASARELRAEVGSKLKVPKTTSMILGTPLDLEGGVGLKSVKRIRRGTGRAFTQF